VGPTAFQALDKAIEAGSTNLGAKAIGGSSKAASAVLMELCTSGFLNKTGGGSPKFNVTPEGRAAWEQAAPPERRRQVLEREQQERRRALTEFLGLVGQKQGKALTKGEQTRFPGPLRQEACDRKLVEPGTKANTYRLLPAGEDILQLDQPVEQQLQRLRQHQQETVARWRVAQQHLQQELDGFTGRGREGLQAAAADLEGRSRKAAEAFDAALAELGAFAVLLSAARELREGVESACQEALQRLESEKGRLADLEARLRQEAEQQRAQLEAFERRVVEKVEVISRLSGGGSAHDAEPPPVDPAPSDDAVWQATRRAYEPLKQQTFRIGGIVKVPDLTDAVGRSVPGLAPAAFHSLLRKWQKEDRLTLQLCNDPRLEPRATEGIQSPQGLLFYVQMR
jgi:hypothetical protein